MLSPINPLTRIYVDGDNGTNTNPGTGTAPLATLGAALSRLTRGGTIYVRGTTTETAAVTHTSPHDVTVAPWGDAAFTVNGSPGAGFAISAASTATLTLHGGTYVGDTVAGVRCGQVGAPAGTGKLVAVAVTARGAMSGFQTVGQFERMDCTRCTGHGTGNDGFNVHGSAGVTGVVTLTDCVGNDCGDEGASPHADTVLHIVGGQFCRNGQSGMAAVDQAVCNISGGTLFEGNGVANGPTGAYGGVTYLHNTAGVIDGATMRANLGRGVWVDTTGAVTLTDYTSTGNTLPDVIT